MQLQRNLVLKTLFRIAIVFVLVYLVYSYWGKLSVMVFKPDTYELFLYPNKDDLTVWNYSGKFATPGDARRMARVFIGRYPSGDYEIGKNCERSPQSTLRVCEETFR